jgi:hypothetical protein
MRTKRNPQILITLHADSAISVGIAYLRWLQNLQCSVDILALQSFRSICRFGFFGFSEFSETLSFRGRSGFTIIPAFVVPGSGCQLCRSFREHPDFGNTITSYCLFF